MKKFLKITLITLLSFFILAKGVELWLESTFESTINSKPDRAYNITYNDFDLHTFFKGITLDEVRIEPLNTDSGTVIIGQVDYATINGLVWIDFLLNKSLHIDEIAFVQPVFKIKIGPSKAKKKKENSIQMLFQDILTRGDLSNFRIEQGAIEIKDSVGQKINGRISNINISALDLQTDSVQFNHLIPFKMSDLLVDIDSVDFEIAGNQRFTLGAIHYRLSDKNLLLQDLSLNFTKDWVEVSQDIGLQKDLVELELKELLIEQLEPSSTFFSQLDLSADKVIVDQLQIAFRKNKKYERPPDTYKPMFRGMINSIPIELNIDSVLIKNSNVTYSELGAKKSKSGSIDITEINASVYGITNMPEQQQNVGQALLKAEAKIAGSTELTTQWSIPYDENAFTIAVRTGGLNLKKLNPTLEPLAGVDIISGQLHKIDFKMKAYETTASNTLIFDYENLDLKIVSEKGAEKGKKKVLLSALANAAIHRDNMPASEKYITATYQTERNIYRSPIVFFIKSLTEGVTYIAPGKSVQKLLHKKKK